MATHVHPVLILFAHPALEKSRVNRVLIRPIQAMDGVTFHDLYEEYPDFDINVKREQQLLLDHSIVVFHHPLFWYSMPSILQEWQCLVLEHGWAYGHEGIMLRGKKMLSAITTGGSETAYQREGYNHITIGEILAPVRQTAHLCGMDYLPPFVVHGTHGMTPSDIEQHSRDYGRLIEAFRDNRLDLDAARKLPRLNVNLDDIVIRQPRYGDAR